MLRQLKFRDQLIVMVASPLLVITAIGIGLLLAGDTTNAGTYGLVALGGLVVAAVVAVVMGRSILGSLSDVTRSTEALASAHRRLAAGEIEAETIEPLPVDGDDHLALLTGAINGFSAAMLEGNESHRGAVKAGLSNIVVNLARRSQKLLDRQVEYLDRLESSEEDPDRLSELFKVDHLATRMRRNAESLMVLAEADPGRRRGGPVDIGDVLRVAMGEVETYEHIELGAIAEGQVSAAAAVDLAHLTAELMENATQFSPPNTPVEVNGAFDGEGRLVITVGDSGIGFTEERLIATNQILADPPELGLGMGRSLGFMVIGRLAQRLGATVTIEPNGPLGAKATVTVPGQLLGSNAPARPAPTVTNGPGPAVPSNGAAPVAAVAPAVPPAAGPAAVPDVAPAGTDAIGGHPGQVGDSTPGRGSAVPTTSQPLQPVRATPPALSGSTPAASHPEPVTDPTPTAVPPIEFSSSDRSSSGKRSPALQRLLGLTKGPGSEPIEDEEPGSNQAPADWNSTSPFADMAPEEPAAEARPTDPFPGSPGPTSPAPTSPAPTGPLAHSTEATPAPFESDQWTWPETATDPAGSQPTPPVDVASPFDGEPAPPADVAPLFAAQPEQPAESPSSSLFEPGLESLFDPSPEPLHHPRAELAEDPPPVPESWFRSPEPSATTPSSQDDCTPMAPPDRNPSGFGPAADQEPHRQQPNRPDLTATSPDRLDQALPSGGAFESGIASLLTNPGNPAPNPVSSPVSNPVSNPAPNPISDPALNPVSNPAPADPPVEGNATAAGLVRRQRGASNSPMGEGRPVVASRRDPEEVRNRLSRYRQGLKGQLPSAPPQPDHDHRTEQTDERDR